jgi:hypothetical protein
MDQLSAKSDISELLPVHYMMLSSVNGLSSELLGCHGMGFRCRKPVLPNNGIINFVAVNFLVDEAVDNLF